MVKTYLCTCDLCSHEWRSWSLPLRCSKCKRPDWNRENKEKNVKSTLQVEVHEPSPSFTGGQEIRSGISHNPNCDCILCKLTKGTQGKK